MRVTAGQVARVMPSDYALSEAERAQGYMLACAHTAASSEVTLGDASRPVARTTSPRRRSSPRCALQRLAPDTMLLHLQTPRTHRLRFLAGQAVTLGEKRRAGATTRTPGTGSRAAPATTATCFFVPATTPTRSPRSSPARCAPATGLAARPGGRFVLGDDAHPLVFARCDTGFAPVKSLIEHALSLDTAPSISLFWLATRADGHFQANQCRAWSEALDHFEFALSSHADAADGASQMASAIRADLFDIDCSFYVAGPQPFVERLCAELDAAGVPSLQVRAEVTR